MYTEKASYTYFEDGSTRRLIKLGSITYASLVSFEILFLLNVIELK